MARNPPKLTVIAPLPAADPLDAPAELGEAGRKFWAAIHRDYDISDSGGLQMLTQICAAADRVAEYAAAISREGATFKTKAGLREHPLLRHELAARSFIVRSLHRLGLDIEPARHEIGRPPGR